MTDIRKLDDPTLEAEPCDNCGIMLISVERHTAPCGAICGSGSAIGRPVDTRMDEPTHDRLWDGPPETDGHYHGECPNGCFKDCCEPPGNLCGLKCLRCFGCCVCGYIHDPKTPHRGFGS